VFGRLVFGLESEHLVGLRVARNVWDAVGSGVLDASSQIRRQGPPQPILLCMC
jgi:hypothetical protein